MRPLRPAPAWPARAEVVWSSAKRNVPAVPPRCYWVPHAMACENLRPGPAARAKAKLAANMENIFSTNVDTVKDKALQACLVIDVGL